MSTALWTSESVTAGHPDKVADIISDTVLDLYTNQDDDARVACEVFATPGRLTIGGEVRSTARVTVEDIEEAARGAVRELGYTSPEIGYSADDIVVDVMISAQSPEIAQAVDNGAEIGAGDQGMMFGYATRESETRLPLGLEIARKLTTRQTMLQHRYGNDHIRPDGKAQVTLRYEDGVPVAIDTLLMSIQHGGDELDRDLVLEQIVNPVVAYYGLECKSIIVNPSGSFKVGGPGVDVGLTGRKIIVDTYGGRAHHGGGAFSGKDLSKVDRSGAYAARHAARTLVDRGIVDRDAEVRVAYGIGIPEPIDVSVVADGVALDSSDGLVRKLREEFDFSVRGLVHNYRRNAAGGNPAYSFAHLAREGHFGCTGDNGQRVAGQYLPWEHTAE